MSSAASDPGRMKWFLLNNHCCLSRHHFHRTPTLLFFFSFSDIMILIFHWLRLCWSAEQEADISISGAASGIHHQRSAQETDSFTLICICLVCQLSEHPHHPTHTVISWLAYNASITSLSLNRQATASFCFHGNYEECCKLVWQRKFGLRSQMLHNAIDVRHRRTQHMECDERVFWGLDGREHTSMWRQSLQLFPACRPHLHPRSASPLKAQHRNNT